MGESQLAGNRMDWVANERTIAGQDQSVIWSFALQLRKLFAVALEGQMDVCDGPETHGSVGVSDGSGYHVAHVFLGAKGQK